MKVENQRIMLTKSLLKTSLIKLLKDKNIYSISIRELCDNAGINRSTFYKYYGNQYELLAEAEDELLFNIKTYLFQMSDENITNRDERLSSILQFFEEHIDLCKLLLNNNIDPDFYGRFFSYLQIETLIQQQLFHIYSEEEQGYVSAFILQGCFQILKEWLNKDNREPAATIAALILELNEKVAAGTTV